MPNGRKRRWWVPGGAALMAAIIAAAAFVALKQEPMAGEATAGSGQQTATAPTSSAPDGAPGGGPDATLGHTALREVPAAGGNAVTLGVPVGPGTLAPGETTSYTLDSDADALYFDGQSDCAGSSYVQWRVTAPDGQESLLAFICQDHGRIASTQPGIWRIDVIVGVAAPEGGSYGFTVQPAGPIREFSLNIPGSAPANGSDGSGTLRGAGATDRFAFTGLEGDVITLTALAGCPADTPLLWGLENPFGYFITFQTSACDDLGAKTLSTNGLWHVTVWNPTAAAGPLQYGFSVSR